MSLCYGRKMDHVSKGNLKLQDLSVVSHNDESSIFSYILRYIYQCPRVYDSHPHGHHHADGKNKKLASSRRCWGNFTHLAKHFSTITV